jgi:hypothetical protein
MPTQREETYSALKTFLNCRQEYSHRYLQLIEKDIAPGAALWIGSLIHACLEMWYRGQSLGEIIDFIYASRDGSSNWIQCEAIMTAYAARYPTEEFEVVKVEDEWRGPLINPETGAASTTITLAGKIDGLIRLEDGSYAIFEHKTTSKDLDKFTASLWSDFQTRFYCIQYGRANGIEIKKAMFNIIKKSAIKGRKGESDEDRMARMAGNIQFKRYLLSFDKALMDEIEEQVWEIKDNMQLAARKGKYYKNESQCQHAFGGMCQYYDLCSSANSPIIRDSFYRKRQRAHSELEATHVTEIKNTP